MRINFNCQNCQQTLEVDSSQTDGTIHCDKCGAELFVPTVRLNRPDDEVDPKRLEPGESLGGFRIKQQVNAGGMGVVYLAHQLSLQRDVALKILSPLMAREAGNIERFQSEVRLQARLDHPNIVPAFEAGYEGGLYYLAMSFVEGRSLDHIVRKSGPLSCKRVMQIALDVAEALGYAWRDHHILHRDIKPSNIMIDNKGTIRLLDLGISKCLADDHALTASGVICGTPQYMSPEQAKGCRDLDCRSDMYSLGATLYFLATGKHPFDGDNQLELLHQAINEAPTPVHQLRPDVSSECSRLITYLMAKDPMRRPGSWREVASLVRTAIQPSETVPAAPSPAPTTKGKGAAAAKGLLAGCGVSIALVSILILLFCYFVYSIFTSPGCGCGISSPPINNGAQVSDLDAPKNTNFWMTNKSLSFGPAKKDWFWAAKKAHKDIQLAGRIKIPVGKSGGIGFVPALPKTNMSGQQMIPNAVFIRLTPDGDNSIVQIEQKEDDIFILKRVVLSQPISDWVPFKLEKRENQLRVTIGNHKTIDVQMYDERRLPTEDGNADYPSHWGVFAKKGATVELNLKPSESKSDTGSNFRITFSKNPAEDTKTDSEPVSQFKITFPQSTASDTKTDSEPVSETK